MRIAMLSWESQFSIWSGGVGVHVTELSEALHALGHDVHVFTRRAGDQPDCGQFNGVHYHRCHYPHDADFVEDINHMCRAMVDRVFRVEDASARFDVLHAHDWLTANALIWIKQGRRRPGVLTIHSTEYARCGNALPRNSFTDRIRYQEGAGTEWADSVIAVSGAVAHELEWMYQVPPAKVTVAYNGVRAERFNCDKEQGGLKAGLGIGPTDPVVLFCGRLSFHKGPDLLLQAIPPMLGFYPSARFVFVGEGEMLTGLQAQARDLGIERSVSFLGRRVGTELRDLYHMADAVCVPSRNEPFGIVVLEAWSAGKPVVVTQCGGPAEYVQHGVTGLHVYPNPDSVGWGLGTLFTDWEKAREMGREGKRLAEARFSWDFIARQVHDVYALVTATPAAISDKELTESKRDEFAFRADANQRPSAKRQFKAARWNSRPLAPMSRTTPERPAPLRSVLRAGGI